MSASFGSDGSLRGWTSHQGAVLTEPVTVRQRRCCPKNGVRVWSVLLLVAAVLVAAALMAKFVWVGRGDPHEPSSPSDTCKDAQYHLVLRACDLESPVKSGRGSGIFKVRTLTTGKCPDPGTVWNPQVMEFKPGTSMVVLLENALEQDVGPRAPRVEDYLATLNGSRYAHCKPLLDRFTNKLGHISDVKQVQTLDINYNTANIHFHGMELTPHLFVPLGTTDPAAKLIQLRPGEQKCYRFDIEEDHPSGSFMYHAHVHGSSWLHSHLKMTGMVKVDGPMSQSLQKQGVTRDEWFVMDQWLECSWDGTPVELCLTNQRGEKDVVNGELEPNFTLRPDETVMFRLVRISDLPVGFRIRGPDNAAVDFWHIGSDGEFFETPIRRSLLVLSFGQREHILVKIPQVGTYRVVSDLTAGGLCYLDCACHNATSKHAFFEVAGEPVDSPVDPSAIHLGTLKQPIASEEITRRREITFAMVFDATHVPAPQAQMDNRFYNETETFFTVKAGTAEEWVIFNADNFQHALHVHVNGFQVKEIMSSHPLDSEKFAVQMDILPKDKWRDTQVIPPQGFVRLWIRFDEEHRGKAVVHCHLLGHEDTGMMLNFVIE